MSVKHGWFDSVLHTDMTSYCFKLQRMTMILMAGTTSSNATCKQTNKQCKTALHCTALYCKEEHSQELQLSELNCEHIECNSQCKIKSLECLNCISLLFKGLNFQFLQCSYLGRCKSIALNSVHHLIK